MNPHELLKDWESLLDKDNDFSDYFIGFVHGNINALRYLIGCGIIDK